MGEYQYYEFQAVNSMLSADARKEMDSYSSRAYVTNRSASYVYHYSSFPGNEESLLAKYFDVFFYIANWGTVRLLFRFPRESIDLKTFGAYSIEDSVRARTRGENILLALELHDEPFGWTEGEGYLSELASLHNDILNGDMRAPYLIWLKNAALHYAYEYNDLPDEEMIEPPVPPGLKSLNSALKTLCDVYRIDEDLVRAAARNSTTKKQSPKIDYNAELSQLSDTEKDNYLRRLLSGERNLEHKLKKQITDRIQPQTDTPEQETNLRHISEIIGLANTVKKERAEQAHKEAERKHQQKLDKLAEKVPEMWDKIFQLIDEKRAKPYEQAVQHLVDLRDLARRDGWLDEFQKHIDQIYDDYYRLSALKRRMKNKDLKPSDSADE